MTVPFFDLTRQHAPLQDALTAACLRVARSGRFILGEEVERFERACASYLGVRHAIGVSSGTDALIVALLSLGIGRGHEVITSAYSFVATAEAIVRVEATPVFVDIDEHTLGLDLDRVGQRIGPKTRAIIPVHLFGRCVDVEPLAAIAPSVPVIEDAAQAFGARLRGRSAGTLGTLGCFSFFPTKPLGGFGDGGLVVTDDDELAAKARLLRVHGLDQGGRWVLAGGNFRLDALQAALLGVKLPHVDAWTQARRRVADVYERTFAPFAADGRLQLVGRQSGEAHHQFVVRTSDERGRDALRGALARRGIGTGVYYPYALDEAPYLTGPASRPCGVAARTARRALALPIYPELTEQEQQRVCKAVTEHMATAE